MAYWRPLISETGLPLAGGPLWFDRVERLARGDVAEILPASALPDDVAERLTAERAAIGALTLDHPRIMGILNTTPDSFSDGGKFTDQSVAVDHAREMIAAGAEIIDIGGESTRPGADFVPAPEEIARTLPVVTALEDAGATLSIDTRKADVAEAALGAGAHIFNDVSALSFDPRSVAVAAKTGAFLCLMHAKGDPKTMQQDPRYEDVLLDVFDYLAERIEMAVAAGVRRDRIIADPGIGFGKTLEHNLALLRRMSLFHALGCPILIGASRKRFIGTLSGTDAAADRVPGSLAVALFAAQQGAQILRVHDVAETSAALKTWVALDRPR